MIGGGTAAPSSGPTGGDTAAGSSPAPSQPGTIALFGAAVLMLLHNLEHHRDREQQTSRVGETFGEVDWIRAGTRGDVPAPAPGTPVA